MLSTVRSFFQSMNAISNLCAYGDYFLENLKVTFLHLDSKSHIKMYESDYSNGKFWKLSTRELWYGSPIKRLERWEIEALITITASYFSSLKDNTEYDIEQYNETMKLLRSAVAVFQLSEEKLFSSRLYVLNPGQVDNSSLI